MEYPHWLMVAGAVLVVVGFIGLAFRTNYAEPVENNLKHAAPTDEPNPPRLDRRRSGGGEREMSEPNKLDPTPGLPDDTPINDRRTSGPNSQRARGRGARDGWRGPRDGRRNAAELSRSWKVFCRPYSRD